MLASMAKSSLGDDVYREDSTTANFEAHIATLLSQPSGLFVASGTMGNQIALRTHLTQPPHSVLCDARAHVARYEAGGVASLSQALLQCVRPSNGIYLTLEDIKRAIILDEDIHYAPTRVISLENTLGGSIMPLSEVRRIAAFARDSGVKLHLDGARLWNAVAAGAGTLEEYGREFDSISVCFSKGLGAPVGSVLLGSEAFIKKARWIRKSIGGGMRQTGPLTNAARTALDEVFPKLVETHAIAKDIEKYAATLGLKAVVPVDTSMLFLDLEAAGLENQWFIDEGTKRGIKFGHSGRIVIHHQITPQAVELLKEVLSAVVKEKSEGGYNASTNGRLDYGSLN
jgi:threonine aldolase